MEDNKTIVILKMLARLSGKFRIGYQDLTEEFDISFRTLYRYLQDIENAGFVLDRRDGSCNLLRESRKFVHSLFHFNEDEVQMLIQLLDKIDVENKDTENLLKKLNILYDIRRLNQLPSSTYEVIEKLKEAIDTINLEMSLTAANLLREDFPASKKALTEIKTKPNTFRLEVPIANYHGVGRFVLGLPGEIKVLGSPGFIRFLEDKRNSWTIKTIR